MNILKNKTLIGGIIFLVLAYGVYSVFFSSAPSDTVASSTGVGADILKLSGELSKVNLNPALFTNPAYENLVDFSVIPPPQPIGRANPFDTIGR